MLRSLHKRLSMRLVVALCPTQVAIVESRRGWRPQSNQLAVLSCTPIAGEPDWQSPLATLRDWLEQNKSARMDVEVVLSDRFSRYAVIPWSDTVQKRSEKAMLSRIRFETLFGELAAQWEIQRDSDVYGKAGIGCALDKAFIAALQELFAAHRLRLASLKPHLVRAFNRWRDRIERSDALLAFVESDHCVLAAARKGEWHSIRSFRLGSNGKSELPMLIRREIMLQGLDEQAAIYLHSVAPAEETLLMQDIDVTMLEFPPSMEAQPMALNMALCRAV